MSMFKKATREQIKLRLGLKGPSGSGKTWTALHLAKPFGKIAVICTEGGSVNRYAGEYVEFFAMTMEPPFHPKRWKEAVQDAAGNGFDLIITDSISHFYYGPGGILDMVDQASTKYKGSSFAAWKDVTPIWNDFVSAVLHCPIHHIATFRSKTEYLQTEEKGRKIIRKVGTSAIIRDGFEYELDIVLDLDQEHNAVVDKTRMSSLPTVIREPNEALGEQLLAWCSTGVSFEERQRAQEEEARKKGIAAVQAKAKDLGIDTKDKDGAFYVWLEERGDVGLNAHGKPSLSNSSSDQLRSIWQDLHAGKFVGGAA